MALSDDLINFDLIETHKENIQQLPGGRSARQLASVLSPLSSGRSGVPTLDETKTLNDAIRQEYEIELQSIADSDDPLDIYDRYVKWTLNAYPSAQATPQSQLRPLLERATKAFLTSSHYKNDPRYLKLWLHYIRLFSDAPRETFAFLARHSIGEGLGLFYEDFAAWLEGAGRWMQAEEVYNLGIQREARPAERLMRKYKQFQQRYAARPEQANEPSSPALPTVRPALAAKMDPFASTSRDESQTAPSTRANPAAPPRSGKPKMMIFSDTETAAPVPTASTANGWDDIGSIKERKKENTLEAKSWAGETLKAGKRVGVVPKMEIFKDPTPRNNESKTALQPASLSTSNVANPRTGRSERVFVNIEAVYPSEGIEYSFQELRAINRGWTDREWSKSAITPMRSVSGNVQQSNPGRRSVEPIDIENLTESFTEKTNLHDTSSQSVVGMPEGRLTKEKRRKVREVKQEVQTVKTRLESPTRRKIKRKGTAEPTMTFHSKAATNEIYDMFNQPLRSQAKDDAQSGDETDHGDDTYSTAGESTCTGRISAATSEFGDDTYDEAAQSQTESSSPWSDPTTSKSTRKTSHNKSKMRPSHKRNFSDDLTTNMDSSQNRTQDSGLDAGFDTQAIAALANQDFGDMDTKMIAQLAGDVEGDEEDDDKEEDNTTHHTEAQDLKTPIDEPEELHFEIQNKPRFIPLPPEDYEPTPIRPYRDPSEFPQHKLPFMTPIVERTESSLAPSTVYNDNEYFDAKTPSRSTAAQGNKYDSPSRLLVDALLLSSPHCGSPASAKRKAYEVGTLEDQLLTSSPQKKPLTIYKGTPKHTNELDNTATQDEAMSPLVLIAQPATTEVDGYFQLEYSGTNTGTAKAPVILDLQCNPCDQLIRDQILRQVRPSLSSLRGFHDHSSEKLSHYSTLKTFARKVSNKKGSTEASPRKSMTDKTLTKAVPPILKFEGTHRVYALKRELGEGAFAPVYLVDSYCPSEFENVDAEEVDNTPIHLSTTKPPRSNLEALKTETPPNTLAWEFYILRLLKHRLIESSSASALTLDSIITAHECHLYRDEAYLVLSYSPQGTLLDLVNLFRQDSQRQGKPVEGLDEVLAMHLSCELLRTMSSLHSVGILHGDLKADNCLVRLDNTVDLTEPYTADIVDSAHGGGGGCWSSKGLCLIDFGRGIDTRAFDPAAKFVADWQPSPQDCAEIREMRPWKWSIDYHGAAGVLHSLLFGKYIETTTIFHPNSAIAGETTESSSGGGGGEEGGIHLKKEYRLKESFKRYWDKELWSDVFGVLLNRGGIGEDDGVREMELRRIVKRMQVWLETEGERKDLRGCIRKAERLVAEGRKK